MRLLLALVDVKAQNWTQIGADIDGEAPDNYLGYSVSLSANGNIVAIGVPLNDGNGADAGHVRVYQNNGGNWTQIGNDINGEATGDRLGNAVSLSAGGDIVAMSALYNDGNGTDAGHVRVYQNIAGNWTQIGQDIDGQVAGDRSGDAVSLSANGSIVAIGSVVNEAWAGDVRVYQNVAGNWTQIGSDIVGENPSDQSGCSVSLSANGNILAIGSRGVEGGNIDSRVRIYENISGSWLQTGNTIVDEPLNEFPGIAVSLNANGNILAVGAPYNFGNGDDAGHVRVYEQCDSNAPPVPNVANLPNVTAECVVTTLTPPTATDGCGNAVIGTPNVTLPIIAQGTTTVLWVYNSGNSSSTQTQNVVIDDVTNPTITCVGNQTVDADQTHFYTVNGTEFDPIGTSDNCGIGTAARRPSIFVIRPDGQGATPNQFGS